MAALAQLPASQSPFQTNAIGQAGFTVGAEATNAINVEVQLKTARGRNLWARGCIHWYLSEAAAGDGITGTAASGGVAAGANGTVISTITGKGGIAVSGATGLINFVITDSSARTVYLVLLLPDGTIAVSSAITFA